MTRHVPPEKLDEADELAAGAERDPVRFPRWLSVLAVAVAVTVAGYVALRPADESPEPGQARKQRVPVRLGRNRLPAAPGSDGTGG